jgi:hypothetical protein
MNANAGPLDSDIRSGIPGIMNRDIHMIAPGRTGLNMGIRDVAMGDFGRLTKQNYGLSGGPQGITTPLSGHVEPGFGALSRVPDKPSYNIPNATDTNPPFSVDRVLENTEAFLVPGEFQLAILKRDSAPKNNKEGVLAWHLAAFDEYIARNQLYLWKHHIDIYSTLSADEIWLGYNGDDPRRAKALAWCGFTLDGIVRVEQIVNGPSGKFSDGYSVNRGAMGSSGNAKAVAMVRGGNVQMVDEFFGRGIAPGALLNLVLTKKSYGDTTGNSFLQYTLTGKGDLLASGSGSLTRTVGIPSAAESAQYAANAGISAPTKPFSPFQLFPVACHDGALPGFDFRVYEDEWGYTKHDARILTFGRTIFEPMLGTITSSIDSPKSSVFYPTVSAGAAFQRQRMTVSLYPYKDGPLVAN